MQLLAAKCISIPTLDPENNFEDIHILRVLATYRLFYNIKVFSKMQFFNKKFNNLYFELKNYSKPLALYDFKKKPDMKDVFIFSSKYVRYSIKSLV